MNELTKLEWFAGMVAQGMAASEYWSHNVAGNAQANVLKAFAEQAVWAAIALIAETERIQEGK